MGARKRCQREAGTLPIPDERTVYSPGSRGVCRVARQATRGACVCRQHTLGGQIKQDVPRPQPRQTVQHAAWRAPTMPAADAWHREVAGARDGRAPYERSQSRRRLPAPRRFPGAAPAVASPQGARPRRSSANDPEQRQRRKPTSRTMSRHTQGRAPCYRSTWCRRPRRHTRRSRDSPSRPGSATTCAPRARPRGRSLRTASVAPAANLATARCHPPPPLGAQAG